MPTVSNNGVNAAKRKLYVIVLRDSTIASTDRAQGAIVRVTSTDEAVEVVRFATSHKVPLAVKGGGYSTSGASTTHGGILLDISKMRKVIVDPTSRIVTAEGGALWEDVDIAAGQYGLAVVGSTRNQIGVGGSTLGGGYGWLTGEYGLAIDNLIWVKMILADGRTVTASDEQYPDLFWAIRGAGQSFGVATELGFQAHKQDHLVFAGTLLFSANNLPSIVQFANQFKALSDGKQAFYFGFTAPHLLDQSAVLVVIFYNGTRTAAEEFFSPLLSLEPVVNETNMLPYDSLNGMLNAMGTVARRKSLDGFNITLPLDDAVAPRSSLGGSNITLPLDIQLVKSTYQEFDRIIREYPEASDSALLFELLPYTQIVKVPNDATAFANRGPYYNVSSIFRWHDSQLDEKIRSLQKSLMDRIGAVAGIASQADYNVAVKGTGIYANYAVIQMLKLNLTLTELNGNVAMVGSSYGVNTQWNIAAQGLKGLKYFFSFLTWIPIMKLHTLAEFPPSVLELLVLSSPGLLP
ncbi:hypothetical protein CDV55_102632 [Aspergillus turcosus]|uniref:FAD-binding PCMH-type domain-containing protein n=1 Tax=Aspergillus turcosus TaxID=1245748 RepID=A0A397H112_9EURO|nr:hypothetical protein CDV55_102632 [Aspergillus turcosus]RLL95721.1 hypothetical protein CFD26_104465 [Aspergillus turcosus]